MFYVIAILVRNSLAGIDYFNYFIPLDPYVFKIIKIFPRMGTGVLDVRSLFTTKYFSTIFFTKSFQILQCQSVFFFLNRDGRVHNFTLFTFARKNESRVKRQGFHYGIIRER